jgi:translation initiation factor IF-3
MSHTEIGEEVLNKFISMLSEVSQVEKAATLEGRWLIAILAPIKK